MANETVADKGRPAFPQPTNTMGRIHKEWIAAADSTMNCASLAAAICPVSRSDSQCAYDITAQTCPQSFTAQCNLPFSVSDKATFIH